MLVVRFGRMRGHDFIVDSAGDIAAADRTALRRGKRRRYDSSARTVSRGPLKDRRRAAAVSYAADVRSARTGVTGCAGRSRRTRLSGRPGRLAAPGPGARGPGAAA